MARQDPPPSAPPKERARHGFRNFLIVLLLAAAAFAAGLLLGELRLRQASTTWKADQQKLEASLAESTKSLEALKATQALWQIDAYVSEILGDVADNNFGLARDAAESARLLLQKASPGFTVEQNAALAPLDAALRDLGQGATALTPDAKIKARAARSLLRSVLKTAP